MICWKVNAMSVIANKRKDRFYMRINSDSNINCPCVVSHREFYCESFTSFDVKLENLSPRALSLAYIFVKLLS